jgi:small subunit ribosomal protein S17
MPRKKKDENEEVNPSAETTEATADENMNAASADDFGAAAESAAEASEAVSDEMTAEAVESVEGEAGPAEAAAEPAGGVADKTVETAPSVEEGPKKVRKAATPKASKKARKPPEPDADAKKASGKRAEKIGIISSDKMMKTVTVRVDRLVKHPIYRKYVKRRKKFMAHDELGAKIGDKVKIVETRPLSARKRWRVVEILHKAER